MTRAVISDERSCRTTKLSKKCRLKNLLLFAYCVMFANRSFCSLKLKQGTLKGVAGDLMYLCFHLRIAPHQDANNKQCRR